MSPDDEMNPAFEDAVWQVQVFKGRPMSEDKVTAPIVLDDMPSVYLGREEEQRPVHDMLYGPVLVLGDAEYLGICVPVSVTRHEVETRPETDLRSNYRVETVRTMHRPIFGFNDDNICVDGFETTPEGHLVLARWFVQPFGVAR